MNLLKNEMTTAAIALEDYLDPDHPDYLDAAECFNQYDFHSVMYSGNWDDCYVFSDSSMLTLKNGEWVEEVYSPENED